jgi:4-cresol dehydrogenase (hydroxylating)
MPAPTPPYELPDAALRRLRDALGDDAVHVDEAQRDEYRDPYWYQGDRSYDSSAVLYPSTTEQVQEIVRIAGAHGVPLWTSSQGRNNGYGGPSGRVRGSVLISFRRMNRVLEVNHDLAYAVVEPGVRWFDLYDHLQATGNDDLLVSITDIGWGSVIGNSLDNGVTYQPLGSDFMAPTGMEVVLADGSLLRTGMGAIPDSPASFVYKRGLGPTLDPLFIQSNFGIVTKMGYWLMPKPEAYAPLMLTIPRNDQLAQAVDIIRQLRMEGALRGVPSFYNIVALAWQIPSLGEYIGGKGILPDAELDRMAREANLGRWVMRAAVWGNADVVAAHVKRIKERWSEIEGSRVDHPRTWTRDEWGPFEFLPDKIQAGVPSLDMAELVPDGIGHIGFSPVIPLLGSEVAKVERMFTESIERLQNDNLSAGALVLNDRSVVFIANLNLVLSDEAQVKRSFDTAREMIRQFGAAGYGEYRAHIDLMDLAAEQYSCGDHAYRRFVEKIKDAVDPQGIFNPGRHGIWPANRRP